MSTAWKWFLKEYCSVCCQTSNFAHGLVMTLLNQSEISVQATYTCRVAPWPQHEWSTSGNAWPIQPTLASASRSLVTDVKNSYVWQFFTARRYASAVYAVVVCLCVSVCVSVCLSVTLWYCIKTAKLRITQIMPNNSPGTLIFCWKRSRQNSKRSTLYGGNKCRWNGLKSATFDENSL